MLGGKGKGGRVSQRESPSGTEVSPCLRVANLQKIFLFLFFCFSLRRVSVSALVCRSPTPSLSSSLCVLARGAGVLVCGVAAGGCTLKKNGRPYK
jgi:hypothetical protein